MTQQDGTARREGRHAQANGLNIYYEEYGAGQPLLLIHGGSSTGRGAWDPIAPDLAKRFRVITPDSRGHGRTNNPRNLARALGTHICRIDGRPGMVALPSLAGSEACRLPSANPLPPPTIGSNSGSFWSDRSRLPMS